MNERGKVTLTSEMIKEELLGLELRKLYEMVKNLQNQLDLKPSIESIDQLIQKRLKEHDEDLKRQINSYRS